ncbi:hypothetical protein SHDE107825_03165 [Shewanella denitrificans]|jgi:hypothetical protein
MCDLRYANSSKSPLQSLNTIKNKNQHIEFKGIKSKDSLLNNFFTNLMT